MRTVYVMSDDQDERDLLSKALGRDGNWHVAPPPPGLAGQWLRAQARRGNGKATNGKPAVRPDVAIIDLEMQGALSMAERARSSWPGCAIVLRSGRAPDELSLAGRLSGAIGFLHEDLDALVLSQELEHLLALVQLAGSAISGPAPADGGPQTTDDARPDLGTMKHRLAAHPRSAGEARSAVAASLRTWSLDSFTDDAALLVTELVSNAVSHAGSEVEVSVLLRPDAVRVEVADFSPVGKVEAVPAADDAEGGRGLGIVESLASRWGVITHADGKTVWFELDRGHGAASA